MFDLKTKKKKQENYKDNKAFKILEETVHNNRNLTKQKVELKEPLN